MQLGKLVKLTGLLALAVALYMFSDHRGKSRKIAGFDVHFKDGKSLYITEDAVNKLLIQNYGPLLTMPKENIVLNTIEEAIEANEMVKKAQVYLTIDGALRSEVVQRKPIGRIEGNTKFYLDDQGKRMPLSKSHSARVPIISGKVTDRGLEEVHGILRYVNKDPFLRKNVIAVHMGEAGGYELRFRLGDFVVQLDDAGRLGEKFNNFKAFYAKAERDKTLGRFATVNLEFGNQVVCTKI